MRSEAEIRARFRRATIDAQLPENATMPQKVGALWGTAEFYALRWVLGMDDEGEKVRRLMSREP